MRTPSRPTVPDDRNVASQVPPRKELVTPITILTLLIGRAFVQQAFPDDSSITRVRDMQRSINNNKQIGHNNRTQYANMYSSSGER